MEPSPKKGGENIKMNRTEIYQLISILFQYPDEELLTLLPELQVEVENLQDSKIQSPLSQFLHVLAETPEDQLIEHYIEHFDFGRTTNLYITYFHSGEARERGIELLKLKEFYKEHGFDITDNELPDYLPLMLEFCGNVPIHVSNDLLQNHYEEILEIRNRLHENHSYYAQLLDALILLMEKNGVTMPEMAEINH